MNPQKSGELFQGGAIESIKEKADDSIEANLNMAYFMCKI